MDAFRGFMLMIILAGRLDLVRELHPPSETLNLGILNHQY